MRHAHGPLSIVLCLGAWFAAVDLFHLVSPAVLPELLGVGSRLRFLVYGGDALQNLGATAARFSIGLFLGSLLGIIFGTTLGLVRGLYSFLELPLEFLRSLPVTALLPIFFFLFGIGDEGKIAMAVYPTSLLMTINTYYGVTNASADRLRVGRVFGANRRQLFFSIVFFEALPQVLVGLRLALSTALTVTVASEMFIGTEVGIGQKMFDAYLTSSTTTLYAYLVLTGAAGYTLNKTFLVAERRILSWTGTCSSFDR